MSYNPANEIQDYLVFGEFGGVNPSIEDSSTFTFLSAERMEEVFQGRAEGCYLYSRHINPTNEYLSHACALMEGSECAQITSSGMSAISCVLMQLCNSGDEIVSSRTIYGGTYALLKNFLPKLGIITHFVDITNLDDVKSKINEKTKVIYCESISNPLLEVADIPALKKLAGENYLSLVIDNTFSPLMIAPIKLGADVVVYSLTKFVNGSSDCIAGAICGTHDFISSLRDVNSGACMLLGPVMDPIRAASIFKNLRTLHVRMVQHSRNALFLAENIGKLGIRVFYPGLRTHPQHELIRTMLNPDYGFGGMVTIDVKDEEIANKLMIKMQEEHAGYFAVSLGFYKTLFSSPGTSTSSEIPKEEQEKIGLSPGLIRFSVGIDHDIERTFDRIKKSMEECGVI
jgi:methionine-gamma-lyase